MNLPCILNGGGVGQISFDGIRPGRRIEAAQVYGRAVAGYEAAGPPGAGLAELRLPVEAAIGPPVEGHVADIGNGDAAAAVIDSADVPGTVY